MTSMGFCAMTSGRREACGDDDLAAPARAVAGIAPAELSFEAEVEVMLAGLEVQVRAKDGPLVARHVDHLAYRLAVDPNLEAPRAAVPGRRGVDDLRDVRLRRGTADEHR